MPQSFSLVLHHQKLHYGCCKAASADKCKLDKCRQVQLVPFRGLNLWKKRLNKLVAFFVWLWFLFCMGQQDEMVYSSAMWWHSPHYHFQSLLSHSVTFCLQCCNMRWETRPRICYGVFDLDILYFYDELIISTFPAVDLVMDDIQLHSSESNRRK